jgi:pilus assembly protein Flp/PilA
MRRLTTIAEGRRLLSEQDGATAIEYAVIAAGIACAIIVTIGTLGGKLATMWGTIAGMFS